MLPACRVTRWQVTEHLFQAARVQASGDVLRGSFVGEAVLDTAKARTRGHRKTVKKTDVLKQKTQIGRESRHYHISHNS